VVILYILMTHFFKKNKDMAQYIDKSAVVAEIERLYKKWEMGNYVYEKLISFLDTIEVKEINTWHLQKNEDIYDAVKDWSIHSFVCLMDDGTVQKFTGIRSECYDGSINTHIDAINDEYGIDNIIFWIETPNL